MSTPAVNRRDFLSLLGASAATAALPTASAHAAPRPHAPSFSFLFITDTHLEPELDATHGVELALKRARALPHMDFAVNGGDHIFDALGVPKERATALFDLYAKTEQTLGTKMRNVVGNHDCFGVYTASGVATTDPEYGKKMYTDRFGPTYYTFDHKGHHFIVLDSIGITADRAYEARIDDTQLAWLAADLAGLKPGTPVVVITHIPLVTAIGAYAPPAPMAQHGTEFHNGPAAIKLFEGHNVLGVLQGHTHVNETVLWHGVPYITSGAVCGNWWHGTRFGTPEGFTVVTIADGRLTTHYEPTGFHSVAPENT